MKLTKKFWVVIGTGVFIIALAALGTVVFQQVNEKSQLDKQLVSSQSKSQGLQLESLSSQRAGLENRLNQTKPEFESLKTQLSQPIGSSSTAAILFDGAKTYGLVVTSMTSTSPTDVNVKGAALVSMSVSIKVEGNVSKLVKYIAELNNLLKTSTITSLEMTFPKITSTDNASATIQMVIYAYGGE